MDLSKTKFAFLSHEVEGGTGFPEAFSRYLHDAGASLVYIRFPFVISQTKAIWVEKWSGGNLISRKRSVIRFFKPHLMSFAKDFVWVMTVGWVYIFRSDFVLASNNLMGLAALILKKLGLIKKFCYLVVDFSPIRFSNPFIEQIYVFLDRLIAKNADSVWTMSLAMIEAREKAGRFKLSEITYRLAPMGNNSHVTFAQGEVPFKKTDLIFVGNPTARNYRADLLLTMAAIIKKEEFSFRLIFVGPGDTEPLYRKAEALGINRNIIFKGSIPDPLELEKFVAGCGIGFAPYDPNLKDNFSKFADPSKIKVYLGCGLPVITTDVPPIARELEHSGAGLIADFSPEDFAQRVITYWSDDKGYVRSRTAALEMGRQFSWPRIFDRLMREENFKND